MRKRNLETATDKRATRVLLVEDNALLAETTAELIRHMGFKVRIAASGKDALDVAVKFRPEIVLCDVRLPDIDGLDVARALYGLSNPKPLIAICTGMSETDVHAIRQYSDAPVNVFLCKPLTREKLEVLVSELRVLQQQAPAEADTKRKRMSK